MPPSEEGIGLDLTYFEEGLTEHYAAGSRLEPTGIREIRSRMHNWSNWGVSLCHETRSRPPPTTAIFIALSSMFYASTESKRNKSSNSSIQFNSNSAWYTFSLVYFNLPERVKTTRSYNLKFRLPFDSGRSWYLIRPVRVMNCYRKITTAKQFTFALALGIKNPARNRDSIIPPVSPEMLYASCKEIKR